MVEEALGIVIQAVLFGGKGLLLWIMEFYFVGLGLLFVQFRCRNPVDRKVVPLIVVVSKIPYIKVALDILGQFFPIPFLGMVYFKAFDQLGRGVHQMDLL